MIHRRGVLPALVLLVLVVVGGVLQIARGSAAPDAGARATATPTPTATPTAAEQAVLRSLAAVERAYDAGNVRRLCRPGALLDPAVIRAQDAQAQGCESELESLKANVPRLRVTVRTLALERDLATADVLTTTSTGATVDFVRRGQRWLMSFSDSGDPLPALAGAT
jgi:hypothetical protein